MKILILSCDTGEGHNSAGRAVREAAELKGHTVEMMEMFLLSGKRTSHAVAGAYVGIVKHIPFFFGFIYKAGMLISSSRRKSPVYFANALLGKKLASYIDGHDFDQIAAAFKEAKETKGMPTVIIAKTTKGKGVSFMEGQAGWHGKAPNDDEYKTAMEDLEKVGEALCQK